MILFLDFDGVLHPDPCFDPARLFENVPRLVSALEAFPEVSIVLSTAWRNLYPLERLTATLTPPLAQRVVGATPNFGNFSAPPHLIPYHRQAECEHWLRGHDHVQRPWVAVDDRPLWFEPRCDQLITCDPSAGFDDASASRLTVALRRARFKAASDVDLLLT